MYLPSWLRLVQRRLFGPVPAAVRRRNARRVSRARPRLEALEDRVVPSNIGLVVDNSDNNGTNSATVFDPAANKALGNVRIPVSSSGIGDVALVNQGALAFVTDFDNQLFVLDLSNPNNPTLASGNNPISISNPGEDIAVSPDQKFLVVSDGSVVAPLSIVSIASQTQIGTFNFGSDANSVDITNTGSVLATSAGSNNLRRLTINSSGVLTDTGESMSVSNPNQVTAAPDGASGIVVSRSGSIESFLIPGLTPVDTRSVSGTVLNAVFDPAGDRVFVRSTTGNTSGTLTAFGFNSTTGQLSSSPLFTIPVSWAETFYGMDQLAISQDGSELFVPDDNSHSIDVFNASNGSQLATISSSSIYNPTGIALTTSRGTAATVTAQNATATFSTNSQTLTLTANVSSTQTVNEGTVTFTVEDSKGNPVGSPVPGNVSSGVASANFTLPASEPVGTYTIAVSYSDLTGFFFDNGDTDGTLTITPANVTTTAANASAAFSSTSQTVALSASVADSSFPKDTVDEGTVTFTVMNGSASLGSASGTVSSGTASADFTLPAGQARGSYAIDVSYSDSQGNFVDSGDNSSTLTVTTANVATTANNVSAVYSLSTQNVTLSASVADTSNSSDVVNEGTVAFTILNGSTVIGSVSGTVSGGKASANFTLPAGQAAGSYTIAVTYSDSKGNYLDSGDKTGTLTLAPAKATTTAANDSTVFRTGAQNVTLTADVSSTVGSVNEGEATFTVLEGSTVIGTPTTSGTINNGQASVSYVLPARLAVGNYTIAVSYNDISGNFIDSVDTDGVLTVKPANVTATAVNASAAYSPNAQSMTLNANIADTSDSSDIVDEGTVAFTVKNGSTIVGSVVGTVSSGKASAAFGLPAGLAVGDYILDVSYSDSQGNFRDSDDQSGALTVQPANVYTTAINPPSVVYSTSDQSMTLSANVADITNPGDIVNEGSVLFTVLRGSEVVRSIAGSVSGGKASADFTLPAGDAAGSYTIAVHYIDSPSNFLDGGGRSATLTVAPDNVTITASNATASYSTQAQILMLNASIANTSIPSQTVNEGTVTFTIQNGSTTVGSVVGTVSGGDANAAFTLPAGLTAGNYTIGVSYSDSKGNFIDSGDDNATLTIGPINVATTANNVSTGYSTNAQIVTLSANVVNTLAPSQAIDEGVVTFTVLNGTKTLGSVVGSVSGGNANATFTLPAGQAVANYTIAVSYSDSSRNFLDSSDSNAELIIAPANVTTTAPKNVSSIYNTNTQTLALSATVADASIPTDSVDEGAVTFTVQSGSRSLGSVVAAVSGGKANADFTLPAGQAAGSYTLAVSYSDSKGNFIDSSDTNATISVSPANVTVAAAPVASTVYSTDKAVVNLSANVSDVSVPSDTVNEGLVTFAIQNGATTIGSVQAAVNGGTANAALTLPAGLAVGSYNIAVRYSDNSGNFSDSGDTAAVLAVTPANATVTAVNASAAYGPNAQSVTLSAVVADASDSSDIVDEGTVAFTVKNGSTIVGSAVGTVSSGKASIVFGLPAGLTAGDYSIDVGYSDSQGNFLYSGDQSATLTVKPTGVITTAADASTTFRTTAQTVMLSAAVAYPADPNNAVGDGVVMFTVQNGSTKIGSAAAVVNGGTADTALTLPAGLAAGSYKIVVTYSDSQGNILDSGDTSATLTVGTAVTTAQLTSVTLMPALLSLTTTETLTAHISSSTAVTQGAVTFFVSGHSISANVDGNGNATATVTLPMLDLLGPQAISVSYGDAVNNLTASSDTQTAAWQLLNVVLPSTATFSANRQSITADLFGLFITYTNGLLTEIDFGSSHLVFSYNASGKLSQVTFDGMALLS